MIRYSDKQEFTVDQLRDLFLSVGWSSGQYPDRLQVAMRGSHSVVSAWDGDQLVGLMNCLADGVMTAYFHYLLVRPEYQGKGIGKQLTLMMLDRYKDYARKVLIAYNEEIGFYEHLGFKVSTVSSPMFITYLTT